MLYGAPFSKKYVYAAVWPVERPLKTAFIQTIL
ncbi:hypothetical protein RUMTOR_00365 [[Ruminococcus] torques ATCC 27756]|uniref:Uncharacterized protein n=1 Tax=[Ruminococcus] torques ATCC 27756 TaxID=411460 RepID=A5KJG8_9FIRM|nr:hypothetical protein RUMTOR_00365 [[Ruminococcus] torques ATCC 27756]